MPWHISAACVHHACDIPLCGKPAADHTYGHYDRCQAPQLAPVNPFLWLQVIVPLDIAQAFVERCGGELPSVGLPKDPPSPSGFDHAGACGVLATWSDHVRLRQGPSRGQLCPSGAAVPRLAVRLHVSDCWVWCCQLSTGA